MRVVYLYTLVLTVLFYSCDSTKEDVGPRFTRLLAEDSGVDFINELAFDKTFNIYTYRNFYNGGGVGIGDFDKDGLQDIYFTSNMGQNKLYRNLGELQFEDITERTNASGKSAWSTGVSVADVNGDGWLDIYVCNSGDVKGDNKQNELFINNGDLTFTEKAAEYGVADKGYSTHAAFFDYDKDGDLDMYLLNNSYQAIGSFNLNNNVRDVRDVEGGDKLFRNDGNVFTDVSESAGIYGSIIGFGLGVTVGDVNRDGWPDIFVSNDFFERDYLYVNQKDGTFSEELVDGFRSISGASMGADMADINNDGLQDIFVTEMLPGDYSRLKTKTTFENWDKYQKNVDADYYHQYTRNMLHQNLDGKRFQEIGRLKGVHATDWSWGALIADLNSDGYKDIFVANGIYQDLTDQDYLNFVGNEETMSQMISKEGVDYAALIDAIPSNSLPNYMFENQGRENNFDFNLVSDSWGFADSTFSNGAAYVDLDNDGDLEIVVNNVNMASSVYRNNSIQQDSSNYIQISLSQEGKNPYAVGASIEIIAGDLKVFQEHYPTRGFQSSMDYVITMGVGEQEKVDELRINWPDNTYSIVTNVEVNQRLEIDKSKIDTRSKSKSAELKNNIIFSQDESVSFAWSHSENTFVDFDRNKLLYHMRSTDGPCLCKGDVNNDGKEDVYLGGAKDQPGELYIQKDNGVFELFMSFEDDRVSEDVDCAFGDIDNDGDIDLYVASGGFEFPNTSSALADRLYINDEGRFEKSAPIYPTGKFESSSSVDIADYDADGDMDILVSIGFKPFQYGVPESIYVLKNDGAGNFTNSGSALSEDLEGLGLITDASFNDVNGDGYQDIVAVGEWMSPEIFIYDAEQDAYDRITESVGLYQFKGWWQTFEVLDYNGDGLQDLVVGNIGLNTMFKTGGEDPLRLYIGDFDKNGSVDHVFAQWEEDGYYPMALMHNLVAQLPGLKKRFNSYVEYADLSMEEIFSKEELEGALILEAPYHEHMVFLQNSNQQWTAEKLDYATQVSSVFDIAVINKDGSDILILGGNNSYVKPEMGKYDASYGNVLVRGQDNKWSNVINSGLLLSGDVRNFQKVKIDNSPALLVGINDEPLTIFRYEN